ncbi:MAG TPA: GFA family protein [Qipengyuania sp.]|nr:GFA family protein [Qipengyuania sp.]
MNGHEGQCYCGAIRLILRDDPVDAASCNCSLCRRVGGLWHYCHPDLVTVVSAKGAAYRQGDCMLDTWHCARCGCTTHWTAVDADYPRMAVNLRMFEPALWTDLPVKLIDGASY